MVGLPGLLLHGSVEEVEGETPVALTPNVGAQF